MAYDDNGEILTIRTKKQLACDIVMAELMALQEGAIIASEMQNPSQIILVSDNRVAVEFFTKDVEVPRTYNLLVRNIKKILGTTKVCWKSRADNSLADALAVLALRRTNIKDKDTPGIILFGV